MLFALVASIALSLDEKRLLESARALGAPAVEGLVAWQKMRSAARGAPELEKLSIVNRFFNERIRFLDDHIVWGAADYWATPLQTLHKGAGDCEDFAIAKYFSLLALGISPSRLRLTYVVASTYREDTVTAVAHMVLTYYPQGSHEPLILDNLVTHIQPASLRPDLRPVFSFNSEGLWEQMGAARSSIPVNRLSPFRDLLQRVALEGFH